MKFYTNTYIDNILNNTINDKYLFHYLFIITYIRTYRFKDKRYCKSDFIPLNIDVLRKIINYDNAHIFVKELIDLGLIETNNIFSRKKHISTGYRLSKEVLNHKFYIPEETDEKLNTKIKRVYDKLKLKVIEDDSTGYGYVTECMEDLVIDKELAYTELTHLDEDTKEVAELAIDNFEDKFCTVDKTGNRLHNNLTNLYSPLRKHLSYKGEKLVQGDIRNSQLIFLYLLMRECSIDDEELNKFRDVVCDYGFYEFFAEKMRVNLTEELRKEFKINIFEKLLFGSNKSELSETEEIFKKEFPSIFYVIRSIKTDNYKELSIMLQRKESQFIFSCVRRLDKTIPLFTIHDSIVTTVGNEQKVSNALMLEFYTNFGIKPKIKIEKFA